MTLVVPLTIQRRMMDWRKTVWKRVERIGRRLIWS